MTLSITRELIFLFQAALAGELLHDDALDLNSPSLHLAEVLHMRSVLVIRDLRLYVHQALLRLSGPSTIKIALLMHLLHTFNATEKTAFAKPLHLSQLSMLIFAQF